MTFFGSVLTFGCEGLALGILGIVAYAVLKNRSASWRHLTLTATIFGLLMLPALAVVPPMFRLPVPEGFGLIASTDAEEAVEESSVPRTFDDRSNPTKAGESGAIPSFDVTRRTRFGVEDPLREAPSDEVASEPAGETTALAAESPRPSVGDQKVGASSETPSANAFRFRLPITSLILFGWLLGAAVTAALPVIGLLGIHQARLASQSVQAPLWQNQLDDLCLELGIRRKVDLRASSTIRSALTWGLLRPTILLPANADQWSDGQRRIVLLHELAHIRRHDWATQMLASLCCCLHWFNPMVWWVSRQMRMEREHACDDIALLAGVNPTEYAENLFQLAQQFRQNHFLAAIPMAHQSRLEQRLRSVLDHRRRRETPSHRVIVATFMICGIILLPVALTGAADDKTTEPPATAAAPEGLGEAAAAVPAEEAKPVEERPGMEKIRIVNGDDGKPIAGALVSYDPKVNPSAAMRENSLTAVARTDERGEVVLPKDTLAYLKFRVTDAKFLRGRFASTGMIIPGAMLYKSDWPYGHARGQKILKLWPGEAISGTVKYDDDKPAGEIEFQVVSPNTNLEWTSKVGQLTGWGPQHREWRTVVETDASGRFSFAAPPRDLRGPLHAQGNSVTAAPFRRDIELGAADIRIERGTIVRGIYRDPDGRPVKKTGVSLHPVLPNGEMAGGGLGRSATTDDKGRFVFPPAASGPHVFLPYRGRPERLDLQPDKDLELSAQVAPHLIVKFDFENSMGSLSGNFNFSLRGDVTPKGGGEPVEVVGYTFKDPGKQISFRVPAGMKNAKLHFSNWTTQSVRIIDAEGHVILPSEDAKPIEIPDLTNPPKLKICMGKAARFYVKVLEADGAPAGDIEVTGEAIGVDGVRKVGPFRRSGDVWERGGLFAGERVTVTIKRGGWSARSKPSKLVQVGASGSNKVEFRLPAMTVDVDKPRDGVFFGYTGYMTYVIELKDGRFRFWFESDAKTVPPIAYPLSGKFTAEGDTITLNHPKLIQLTSIWKCRSVNGVPTLWRRDALDQHAKKPLELSVDELRRWGGGSILAFTKKSGEWMWKNRTAPKKRAPEEKGGTDEKEKSSSLRPSLKISKPGKYELGGVSFQVRATKDADGLVRNELTLVHDGPGGKKIEDTCALAFGEGSWALSAKTIEGKPGRVWVSVCDQWGVHTYEFDPVAQRARFSRPGFDLEARWSMPAKRFLEGPNAQFADPDVVAWGKTVLPDLKPEPAEANKPQLEVRLIAADGGQPEMVRPTVARRTVNYRRMGRFVPLGERVLGKDDLVVIGAATGGVFRRLYGIRSNEAAERFEAFRKEHAGRRIAFIKDGQVVNQRVLNADFKRGSFLSSTL